MSVPSHYNNVQSRHANTVKIYVDGDEVAEGMSLSTRESGGTDGTYTIGSAKPRENVHNRWQGSANIQRVIFKESAIERFRLGGTDLLELPVFEIVAVDEADGTTLFTLAECTLSERTLQINANSRIMSDVSVLPLDIQGGDGSRGAPVSGGNLPSA